MKCQLDVQLSLTALIFKEMDFRWEPLVYKMRATFLIATRDMGLA